MRDRIEGRGGTEQTADRASAGATALALRRLAETTRGVAAWQRTRAAALREVADALIAEADAADPSDGTWSRRAREEAARMALLADHADTAADVLDQQVALAVSWAANADEGRRGTIRDPSRLLARRSG